jgi:hypothetical protein
MYKTAEEIQHWRLGSSGSSHSDGNDTNTPVSTSHSLLLDKAVQFESLDDNAEEGQLRDDTQNLFSGIWKIGNSEGIYPAEIQDEIERLNRKIHPSNFRGAEHRAQDSDSEDSEKASRQGGAAHDSLLDFLPVWTFPWPPATRPRRQYGLPVPNFTMSATLRLWHDNA